MLKPTTPRIKTLITDTKAGCRLMLPVIIIAAKLRSHRNSGHIDKLGEWSCYCK